MILKQIAKERVTLLPGIFKERYDLNRKYLMSLSNQGLLQNFYLEAGIILPDLQVLHEPDTAELHWGWDAPTCQLRGHFLGHWLSAAAAICRSSNDRELKAKLDTIIDELAFCQERNGGEWIGPIPEKYFDMLAKEQHVWSPQYVMHKLIMGLFDAYVDAGNEKALTILDRLSNWYVKWTDRMLTENPHAIYSGEESGMLEMWISLYDITGQEKYLDLAQKYSNPRIVRDLEAGRDTLTNSHANASIPWSHGMAKLYEVTGDLKWKAATEAFWKNAVDDRGFYCTGGQGAGEYWTQPYKLGHFLSESNQEFCTVYNMTRTADYLYRWSGDTAYADYIELNLYNGFLAQQNKETGMPTYFLPLKSASRKKWGTPTRDFWCCHGTLVQAQAFYNSLIYFEDKERLVVSQYIPSELRWQTNHIDVTVTQTVNMKYYNDLALFDERDESQMSRWSLKFAVCAKEAAAFTLSLRVPKWVKKAPEVSINGETLSDIAIENGYLNIHRSWETDELLIYFPCGIDIATLPDFPDTAAFLEGPIVLAGICDGERALAGDLAHPEEMLSAQYEHTYQAFPWKQSTYKTLFESPAIAFKPLYEITDELYTVYFKVKK